MVVHQRGCGLLVSQEHFLMCNGQVTTFHRFSSQMFHFYMFAKADRNSVFIRY